MQDLLMMSVSINPKLGASRDRETKKNKEREVHSSKSTWF